MISYFTRQHLAFTEQRGLVVVDRAFNNLQPQHFQEHVRIAQLETVYDYRVDQLGQQGKVPGEPVILVDGALYVDRMPENYRQISRWVAETKIDPATGKKTKDKPTGTLQIGLDTNVIKHLQRYPWKSEPWYRAYGQRNQVETSNKTLNDAWATNLGDKKSRPGRGYAYAYLVAALAVVAPNIQRIITSIKNVTAGTSSKKRRAHRRKDSSGQPLRRPYEHDLFTATDDESPPGDSS